MQANYAEEPKINPQYCKYHQLSNPGVAVMVLNCRYLLRLGHFQLSTQKVSGPSEQNQEVRPSK